jgi:hypothetical protein
VLSWYALNIGRVLGGEITRWHDDPFRSRDQESSLVYNELMQAWVTYKLVQVLHIYGLMPSVRSNLGTVSPDLSKIETYLRDKTKLENDADVKHAEMLIQKLFAETEYSSIFKQMNFGSMSHFKQMTTCAIPFLMITWLRQLKESFFLQPNLDFFEKGMYCAFSLKPKNTTTSNNIWMSKSAKKKIQQKVESLAYFKPKQRKNLCVALREWAAYIFSCEFEPQTLDESPKDILKSTTLKKRKNEMKLDDLNWAALYEDEAKESKKKMTAIDVKKRTTKTCT